MKIGRAEIGNVTRLVLIDEREQEAIVVEHEVAAHPNPVLSVIERGLSESVLTAAAGPRVPLASLKFLAPLSSFARNVIAVGKNYHAHALEFDKSGFNATAAANSAIPSAPQFFSKATTSLAGPTDAIRFDPKFTSSVDYEGEIGVVIGQRAHRISKAEAPSKVFGFVALNDVTARDLQQRHVQWFLGKSLDTFCPLGPWIATAEAAPLDSLHVRTWVNDELRQDSPLTQLIFDIPTLIEALSQAMTLLPGDIIATGTPVGVGIGFSPPKFLRDGDVVRVEVPGLGRLVNRVEEVRT